jgi:outer membrane protein assembly factor BamA
VARPDDELLLTAAPARFEQVATLSYATRHPSTARTYGIVSTRYARTTRDWFYGFGPFSDEDTRVAFELQTIQTGLRVGTRLLPSVRVQGHGRVEHYRLYDGELPDASGSDPAVAYARTVLDLNTDARPAGAKLTHTGAAGGVDVTYDRRDRRALTRSGVLVRVSGKGHATLGGAEVSFLRSDVEVAGWLPVIGRHRLAVRLRLTQTHALDAASGTPHFLLPTLGGRLVPGLQRRRYTGEDRILASALYRFPIASVLGFTIEGHAGIHAASVYTDVGDQFDLRFSGWNEPEPGATVPLVNAASAGVTVGPIFRDETYLDVAVGVGPEAVTGVRFSFTYDVNSPRPPHHVSNGWR